MTRPAEAGTLLWILITLLQIRLTVGANIAFNPPGPGLSAAAQFQLPGCSISQPSNTILYPTLPEIALSADSCVNGVVNDGSPLLLGGVDTNNFPVAGRFCRTSGRVSFNFGITGEVIAAIWVKFATTITIGSPSTKLFSSECEIILNLARCPATGGTVFFSNSPYCSIVTENGEFKAECTSDQLLPDDWTVLGNCPTPSPTPPPCNVDCGFYGTCGEDKDSCICQKNYYGDRCNSFCNAEITCRGFGTCSDDGKVCECVDGKAGPTCACDAQNCEAAELCSGRGQCANETCSCDIGFLGCACELQCLASVECSGNGICLPDATCQCAPGFRGEDCLDQDAVAYCALGNTVSGFPCLPGILGVLGFGFNLVTGETTARMIPLEYKAGTAFSVNGNTYELPDGVSCSAIRTTVLDTSTRSFRSTLEYRRDLTTSFGLSGNFRSVYLSGGLAYSQIIQESFQQERHLYTSDIEHSMYECSLQDTTTFEVDELAARAVDELSGNRLVESIGTHYVSRAIFGGKVTVFDFVESCVFANLTATQVRGEVRASALSKALSPANLEAGVVQTSSSGCSIFASNTFYSKTVNGGDRTSLVVYSSTSTEDDFLDWIASLEESPGAFNLQLGRLDVVFDNITEHIEAYYAARETTITERDLPDIDESTVSCPTRICRSSSAPGRFLSYLAVSLALIACGAILG